MDKIQFSFLLFTLTLLGADCLLNNNNNNKKYNESCTPPDDYYDDDECSYNSDNGFKCHSELRVCRCFNETSMFYDEEKETCFVKDFGSQCIDRNPYKLLQCNRKSKLICNRKTDSCQCDFQYLPSTQNSSGNSETKCVPAEPNRLCSDSMPCQQSTGLVCSGGFCQCPRPLSQKYNRVQRRCVGFPEAIDGCDPKQEGTISQCVDNSYCGEDGKCHCKSGYSHEYGYRSVCKLDYGQACNMTEEEVNFEFTSASICSYGRGFRCRDGICGCSDSPDTQYDPVQNVCAITQGHFCKINGHNLPCFTGLQCKSNGSDVETCEKVDNDNEENGN